MSKNSKGQEFITKGFQPVPAKPLGVQGGHQPEKSSSPTPPPPSKGSGGKK